MTQNDFKEMILKRLREHGFESYPVKLTNSHKTLGSVSHYKFGGGVTSFKFSRHLINANPGVAENCILHEIAHALDIQNRGTSDHGFEWKRICREIGANPQAKADNAYNDSIYRYHIICESCYEIVACRHTMTSRTIQRFEQSWCKHCGPDSGLEIVDTRPIHVKPVEPAQEPSATFKVSELAKVMGICPKKARRNLRAADVEHLKVGKGWAFATEHENLIKKIISR